MTSFDFMLSTIRRIYESDRNFSYDSMWKTCAIAEKIMQELRLKHIQTLSFPSDGVIDHGGWLMPLGWNPKNAVLEAVLPDGSVHRICSYDKMPCSLMLYSRSVDVTVAVVTPETNDLNGKIVLVTDHYPNMKETVSWFNRGAIGIISSYLVGSYAGKRDLKHLQDSCQWCNYLIPFWPVEGNPFGFSISPNKGHELSNFLKRDGHLVLHAKINAEVSPGSIPLVTGLLPGDTDEEILITAHLFEQGANDNASGAALALALVRALSGQKLKRGIRLMFTHEVRSLQAYLNTVKRRPHIISGIDFDMVAVSNDKQILVGDNAPVFPNYAPYLLRHLIEKNCPAYSARISEFSAMDTAFGEPRIGVPMTFLYLKGDPNYHKSSDTPEKISREILETTYSLAKKYVKFLANAQYRDAAKLARIVFDCEYPKIAETAESVHNFAVFQAVSRLNSIEKLVRNPDEKKKLGKLLSPMKEKLNRLSVVGLSRKLPGLKEREQMCSIVPEKTFYGFFSFEKYIPRRNQFLAIAPLIQGWNAPDWVNYALMWADGKRNALEIWTLLRDCGKEVEPEQLLALMYFMEEQGYVKFSKTLKYTVTIEDDKKPPSSIKRNRNGKETNATVAKKGCNVKNEVGKQNAR